MEFAGKKELDLVCLMFLGADLGISFGIIQPKMRCDVLPPPRLHPSPVKPLFTVAQGDRCHGNITLQFIPAPITWETSGSRTKTEPKNAEIGKVQSATASPLDAYNLGKLYGL